MNQKIIQFLIFAGLTSLFLYSTLQSQNASKDFDEWVKLYGKTYQSKQKRAYREKVFNQNKNKILIHNADASQTYQIGINQFSDMTQNQFIETYLNLRVSNIKEIISPKDHRSLGDVDWVAMGKVTPVKYQGVCGSPWAFSAVGAIESRYLIANQSVSLSEQQLLDCSKSYGNYGCNGGYMVTSFKYVSQHGLNTQADYPYVAKDGVCQKQNGPYKISGYGQVKGCQNLQNALNKQPISVAVDATNWGSYKSGIFSNCGISLNHASLLVGSTSSYWLLKDSWGTSWGEKGFIRLARGNTCGICNLASYPNL